MEVGEWVNHKNNDSQLLTGVCKREKEGCPFFSIGISTPHANRKPLRKWLQRKSIVMPTPPKFKMVPGWVVLAPRLGKTGRSPPRSVKLSRGGADRSSARDASNCRGSCAACTRSATLSRGGAADRSSASDVASCRGSCAAGSRSQTTTSGAELG